MHALNKMGSILMKMPRQSSLFQSAMFQGCTHGHLACFTISKSHSSYINTGFRRNCSTAVKETKKEADHVVDFRSDTVTKPTAEMRQAMFEAEVGDDVMSEDPTIKKLEERVSKMFGKEAALFVPSGTMGNLISVMSHCKGRSEEVILGDESHIHLFEQGSISTIGGIHTRTVRNLPDGSLDLKEVEAKIRKTDDHFPTTRAICIENTHNNLGGMVVPISFMKKLRDLADKYKLMVHLDGARVMNAICALQVDPDEIGQYFDSMSMCFSKGLAAPVGSVVIGSHDFICQAKRVRKCLGGGMRQAGVLAACALVALDKSVPRLHQDHDNAKKLAQGLKNMNSSIFTADPAATESNMVFVNVKESLNVMAVVKSLMQLYDNERDVIGSKVHLKMFPVGPSSIRTVTHYHITSEDIDRSLQKFKFVSDMIESGKVNLDSLK